MDVFCSPHWENPDQGDLLVDVQEELTGSGWNVCAFIFIQGKEFLKLIPDLSLNLLSLQRVPVLRC
jgi:hypothetical protein